MPELTDPVHLKVDNIDIAFGGVAALRRVSITVRCGRKSPRLELVGRVGDAVRDLCRVGVDEIEFVPPATIPAEAKMIVDDRRWK